ncbi:MAG: hypothetical protein V4481_04650 [Patescibacteria group bacterium]
MKIKLETDIDDIDHLVYSFVVAHEEIVWFHTQGHRLTSLSVLITDDYHFARDTSTSTIGRTDIIILLDEDAKKTRCVQDSGIYVCRSRADIKIMLRRGLRRTSKSQLMQRRLQQRSGR